MRDQLCVYVCCCYLVNTRSVLAGRGNLCEHASRANP